MQEKSNIVGLRMSIGAVSRATGIPTNTIRTWERRYGFPTPVRSGGGQRLYAPEVVSHLRLVAKALGMGGRPKQVLAATVEELRAMVCATVPGQSRVLVENSPDAWIDAARSYDGETLWAGLHASYGRSGALDFLTDTLVPFIEALGTAWRNETLEIAQEHFASDIVRTFLASRWRPMADRASGPTAICATLSRERHDLGLQMAALVAAVANWRVIYLGADTPTKDIKATADQTQAKIVLISVSSFGDAESARNDLTHLRDIVEPDVSIVVGGSGAPQELDGILRLEGLGQLDTWCRRINATIPDS